MMQVIYNLNQIQLERDTVLTIGAFDGLHLGHQELLRRLVHRAQQTGRLSAVVTFDPHPRAVLSPANNAVCLTATKDKLALLEQLELDVVAVLPFSLELAHMSARDFVQMLTQHLRVAELWVGRDFALGYRREGDVARLQQLGQALGFQVQVVEPVKDGEVVISSTQIRGLLNAGRVREAAEMLGRYYTLTGRVVPATGRGRQLGFPTANLQMVQPCVVPARGVYAAYAVVGDVRYLAAVNIGFRATFGEQELHVEAHLLDFHGDLYEKEIRVQFVERLRDERRFPSADALRAQIERDVAQVREILQ